MKIVFLMFGGKNDTEIASLAESFCVRLRRYADVEVILAPEPGKKKTVPLKYLSDGDFVILFDERGKMLDSPEYAKVLEHARDASVKRVVIVVGGAYGVDPAISKRADRMIALSKMIFPHQLARVMVLEQTYRALSIIAGSKYHHGE